MPWRNTQNQWGVVAKALHWTIFLLVCALVPVGFVMAGLGPEDLSLKFRLYQLHKSTGLLVLAVVTLRLLWRAGNRAPALPVAMRWREKAAAHAVHALLYILLFALPLSGWVMVSASPLNIPTVFYGLFTVPRLTGPDQYLYTLAREAHEILVFVLLALLVAHVGGALWHHFIRRDNILKRMLPWGGLSDQDPPRKPVATT
ncbi:MAG: cytochrome b [Pseudomonadota bacterium]|nr:cytochrome b [Pseudomonadota bacterium]